MSRSGSFGLNPNKSYGSSPSIQEVFAGQRYSDPNGDWLCIKANGAIAQYDFCVIDPLTYKAQKLTTTNAGSNHLGVGVAQMAGGLADTELGFIWLGNGGGTGKGIKGTVVNGYTALANLNTTATAGQGSASSTTLIKNAVGVLANASGGALAVELYAGGYMTVN